MAAGSNISPYGNAGSDINSSGTTAENENIAFDLAYVEYVSPIGMFRVGYQDDGAWGTVFGDTTYPLGKIQYVAQVGAWTALAYIGKFKENSYTMKNTSYPTRGDKDVDQYVAAFAYSFKGGSTGLLYKYVRQAQTKTEASSVYAEVQQDFHFLVPYVKAQLGPVSLQAELIYGWGKYLDWENDTHENNDQDLSNLAGWIDATVDLGMFYAGGTFAYVAGDKASWDSHENRMVSGDVKEGGVVTGGTDWNPALIMFNFDRYYWVGPIGGYTGTQNPNNGSYSLSTHDGGMNNAWFYQARVGVRPTAALDIVASLSFAQADRCVLDGPAGVWGRTTNHNYGWELDVTGTYKITNNLSYMLGVGYLWTGDYYKGYYDEVDDLGNGEVDDIYMVINKLTLTF
jgi:hypothetical protein